MTFGRGWDGEEGSPQDGRRASEKDIVLHRNWRKRFALALRLKILAFFAILSAAPGKTPSGDGINGPKPQVEPVPTPAGNRAGRTIAHQRPFPMLRPSDGGQDCALCTACALRGLCDSLQVARLNVATDDSHGQE
jgi:hypothetical protein